MEGPWEKTILSKPQLNTLGDVKLLIVAMHGGHWNFVLGGGIFMVVVTATLAVRNRVSMQTIVKTTTQPQDNLTQFNESWV